MYNIIQMTPMKPFITVKFILVIIVLHLSGCEKDKPFIAALTGKWKLVKKIDMGDLFGTRPVSQGDQRIFEFTEDGVNIVYDYKGIEMYRRTFEITDTVNEPPYGNYYYLTLHGNDDVNEDHAGYGFLHDTLVISYWVGEPLADFFKRIK